MQTRSADYQSIMADAAHTVEWQISINDVLYTQDDIIFEDGSGLEPRMTCQLFGDSEPEVGKATAAQFSCAILEVPGAVSRLASIQPQYRLRAGNSASEWITLGTFFLDTRQTDKLTGALMLTCFDRMLMADGKGGVPYYEISSFSSWPQPMSAVAHEIAGKIFVQIDPRTTIRTGAGYMVGDPGDLTMREVLGYIAAAHGGNWIITPAGKLRLVPLTGGTDTYTLASDANGLNTAPAFQAWSGVTVYAENDAVFEAGDDSGRVLEVECPWATQATANDILTDISGKRYQPYTASGAIIDMALELGDIVTVGQTGDQVTGPVIAMDITAGGIEQANISAPGEGELNHEYPYINLTRRRIRRVQKEIEDLEDYVEETKEEITQEIVPAAVEMAFEKVKELDFSGWATGYFSETLDNDQVNGFLVDFDGNGMPVRITDGAGHETEVIW